MSLLIKLYHDSRWSLQQQYHLLIIQASFLIHFQHQFILTNISPLEIIFKLSIQCSLVKNINADINLHKNQDENLERIGMLAGKHQSFIGCPVVDVEK